MRVLHFVKHSFPLKVDGYSIRTRYLLQSQARRGHEPTVVTCPEFAAEQGNRAADCENVDGIPHYHFAADVRARSSLGSRVPLVRKYLRNARRRHYYSSVLNRCAPCDLFHVHMDPDAVGQLGDLRRVYGIPLIYEVRGVWEDSLVACRKWRADSKEYRSVRRKSTDAAMQADKVIAISEGLRNDFVGRGVPASKVAVVPNGVDTLTFQPVPKDIELAGELGILDRVVFGYISSIRELEGLDYLIRALPRIMAAVPNSACVIVGDGDYKHQLESMVREIEALRGKVLFTGKIPHARVRAYYSVIDIFVVPRPDERVNQLVTPLKPLEAMAMEKAVLVSNVGGLKELVEDGRTGVVFEAGSVVDLAAKGIVLGMDTALRRDLGQEARRYVVRERDWGVVGAKYDDIACDVVATSNSTSARMAG